MTPMQMFACCFVQVAASLGLMAPKPFKGRKLEPAATGKTAKRSKAIPGTPSAAGGIDELFGDTQPEVGEDAEAEAGHIKNHVV
jgi:hypothetical protein